MAFQRGGDAATGPGGTGPAGKSAYQLWLDAGHVGTVDDFLASLVGPRGLKGDPGDGTGGGGDVLRFSRAGLLSPTLITDIPMPLIVPVARTLAGMRFSVGQAPTGASIVIDVLLNGTTMFPGGTGRPTISANAVDSNVVVPPSPDVPDLAKLTVVIVSVGSGFQGINLAGVIW